VSYNSDSTVTTTSCSLTFAAFLVVHQLEAVVAAAVEATDKVRADVDATAIPF